MKFFTTKTDQKSSVSVDSAAYVLASSQKTAPGLTKRLGRQSFSELGDNIWVDQSGKKEKDSEEGAGLFSAFIHIS